MQDRLTEPDVLPASMQVADDACELHAGWPTFAVRHPRNPPNAGSAQGARRVTFDDLIFGGLIAGLAWVPFWFGGNRPWVWAVNAIYFCGLVAVYEARLLSTSGRHPVAIRRVRPAVAGVVVACLWSLVQTGTWLPTVFEHPVWQAARDALQLDIAGSISINRGASAVAMLRLITAAGVFWLALQLCRGARRARFLVQAVAAIGAAYAVYGIVAFVMFPGTILWFEKMSYVDSLTATFVNRNSYATYAAIGLVCAVSLVVSEIVRGPGLSGNAGRHVANLLAGITGAAGAWLAAALVIALALMLTGSRGGIAAALAGLVSGLALALLQRRTNRRLAAAAGVATAVAVGSVAMAFGDMLAGRLGAFGFQSDDRLAVYATVLRSIADRPVLGFGYGTFEQVFPIYRDTSVGALGVWDKAHNTLLEVVQGLGIAVAAIFMLGAGWLVWRCFSGAFTRRCVASVPLAACAASVAVLSHALVDFSLQIQAVTLTWIALVGAGVAQSWSRGTETAF